jgi:hypothetical protein
MKTPSTTQVIPLLLALASVPLFAEDIPLNNWTVPPYHRSSSSGGMTTMADVTPGIGFVGFAPCRLVDTRTTTMPNFPTGYGPPALTQGTPRNFDLNSDPKCPGIPDGVGAYSLNVTVTNTQGPGFILIYPQGGAQPAVSTVNYVAGQTVANAAIVPAGTNGGVTVISGVSGTDLIIDINGYFPIVYNAGNLFVAVTSNDGGAAILGQNNSAAAGSHGVGGFAGGAGVVHGVQGEVGPAALADSSGVHGISNSNAAAFGVWGEGRGVSAGGGVRGSDLESSVGATYGLFGESHSPDLNAAAVYAFAFQATGNAGLFVNVGVGTAFLETRISGVGYGLYTAEKIRGGSLDIVGAPKNFVAPHPEDPGLEIRYASVEAPTVDVYFRGTASLVNGSARIEVPDHFRFTAREGTYMTTLTPVGRAVALSVEEEGPDGIVVRGSGGARFHYVVWAERAEIVGYEPVVENVTFTPEALEKGGGPQRLPEATRALLVRNGTLRRDGTYNLETARARGWTIPERPTPLAAYPGREPDPMSTSPH